MNAKTVQAYNKLRGHFPSNLAVLYFKGQRITKRDFREIKNCLDSWSNQ